VPKIELAAENFFVDDTATVNMSATANGSNWDISIVDGTTPTGTPISGQALAETYCEF
jgi:hypothetical protein